MSPNFSLLLIALVEGLLRGKMSTIRDTSQQESNDTYQQQALCFCDKNCVANRTKEFIKLFQKRHWNEWKINMIEQLCYFLGAKKLCQLLVHKRYLLSAFCTLAAAAMQNFLGVLLCFLSQHKKYRHGYRQTIGCSSVFATTLNFTRVTDPVRKREGTTASLNSFLWETE